MTNLTQQAFLLLHDPFTGRAAVRHDVLARGLVAAQVGELWLAGLLGHPAAGFPGPRPASGDLPGRLDDEARVVLGAVTAHGSVRCPRVPVQVYAIVADRLVADGVVRRERATRPFARRGDRFPALDLVRAAGPRLQVGRALRAPGRADTPTALLAALAGALHAVDALEPDLDARTRRRAVAVMQAALPPALQTAIAAATSVATGGGLVRAR